MSAFLSDLLRLRRGAWELVASSLIALGIIMLMQPWVMALFTWSFLVTLAGTVLFMIAGKFPS